ncbi:LOW QUALITY PROTEIN: pectinesterase [Cinnamomum micranthum f. kanehirae]|uniref:Pectinesterase n=1 Tax=Cinnamomum micranthum f. kanehirae TaxID=337451 RepID=A0A443P2X0_9MAGN|nr:LOW QUALITY PROTEIN: pectinesterase [Cinnamomum micranthum f. kanehirae]
MSMINAASRYSYTYSERQFYQDCEISGTNDFTFGDVAVLLQNCTIITKKPLSNQKNVITAQGRHLFDRESGISIQNCNIIPSANLWEVKDRIPTYLVRHGVISRGQESRIGDHITLEGWLEWNGSFALDTLYYGEYMNRGPGANTSRSVKWPGYWVITSPDEALNFTVGHLIQGGKWLNSSEVNYTIGL